MAHSKYDTSNRCRPVTIDPPTDPVPLTRQVRRAIARVPFYKWASNGERRIVR